MAVNNKTKATTYMEMAELQAGLGFGVKKFQLVWVFETEQALNNSSTPDGRSGSSDCIRKGGRQGRRLSGRREASHPGVWLYQVSGDSLALELTAKGTKYYRDGDLN